MGLAGLQAQAGGDCLGVLLLCGKPLRPQALGETGEGAAHDHELVALGVGQRRRIAHRLFGLGRRHRWVTHAGFHLRDSPRNKLDAKIGARISPQPFRRQRAMRLTPRTLGTGKA